MHDGEADQSIESLLVSAGLTEGREGHDAVVTPIQQSSIFGADTYGRRNNPNRTALETAMAALEGAAAAFAFPSGMAAAYAALQAADVDHVVLTHDVYGGVYELLSRAPTRRTPTYKFVDYADNGQVAAAIDTAQRCLLWIESPTNPLLRVHDIAALARLAHDRGATVVVDNTFATPVRQQPLLHGADLVVESTTKFIGGHSDLIGGTVAVRDERWTEALRYFQASAGLVPGPFDCWLATRGLRTLAVRLARQEQSAAEVAHALASDPAIPAVHYPGLDPAARMLRSRGQMSGFGTVVSCEVADDRVARAVLTSVEVWRPAASLGGVESTLAHPATMSHRLLIADGVATLPPGLLRLSVGLEEPDRLVADLLGACRKAQQSDHGKEQLQT